MPAGFLNPKTTNDDREKKAGLKPADAAASAVDNKAFFKSRQPLTPEEAQKAAKAKADALRIHDRKP